MAKRMITAPQIKKVYAVARKMGIDNELLHELIENKYKKQHIHDLTLTQAGTLIDYLEGLKGSRYVQLPTGGKLPLATDKQQYKINQLAKQLGWDNPKRLQGFCRKYAGVDKPEWLTKEQAWRVIEGLKSLVKQSAQEKKGGGMDGEPADAILDS